MKRALFLVSGVLLWAAHFLVVYGFTGLACARGLDEHVSWVVGGATLFAAIGLTAVMWTALRSKLGPAGSGVGDVDFTAWMAAGLAAFAAVAVLFEGSAVLLVAPCAGR